MLLISNYLCACSLCCLLLYSCIFLFLKSYRILENSNRLHLYLHDIPILERALGVLKPTDTGRRPRHDRSARGDRRSLGHKAYNLINGEDKVKRTVLNDPPIDSGGDPLVGISRCEDRGMHQSRTKRGEFIESLGMCVLSAASALEETRCQIISDGIA